MTGRSARDGITETAAAVVAILSVNGVVMEQVREELNQETILLLMQGVVTCGQGGVNQWGAIESVKIVKEMFIA